MAMGLVLAALPGCFVTQYARKVQMSHATAVPHPLQAGLTGPVTAVAADGAQYTLTAFDAGVACFQVAHTVPPQTLQKMKFELVAWEHHAQKLADVPKTPSSATRLLDTWSETVPVDDVVVDKIKDADGNVIATEERHVTRLVQQHHTTVEVCFDQPRVDASTRFVTIRADVPPVTVALASQAEGVWMPSQLMFRLE